jgi:ATP-binding cassette subfamily B protein
MERARRQTTGRTVLMSQVLTQMQDIVTVLFLAGGLIAFNAWLILILIVAVIPSFLGETHFNQRTYSLTRSWTPERRELDYLRYIGASDQMAKEVKIFNLSGFITRRFADLSDRYYHANRKIAIRRAAWGSALSAIGTLSYYGAYVFIITQAVGGIITVGTLTFLAGSFERMRNRLQGIMNRFPVLRKEQCTCRTCLSFLKLSPPSRLHRTVCHSQRLFSKALFLKMLALSTPIVKTGPFETCPFNFGLARSWLW